MDSATKEFLKQAINFLLLSTDEYCNISEDKFYRIRNVIEELNDILYGC
jgi:hypothetical protein